MKKLIYLLLPSLLFISSCKTKPLELNVMTFNIRLDVPSDSLNSWQYRKDNAAEMVRMNDVDILGMQEVLLNQMNDLKERLPQYTAIGVGREDGADKGEFSPIFYKKDRFSAIESGTFWVSETPELAGSKGWDASYIRVATWAILKEKATGKEIFAINTHLDNDGLIARKEGGNLLLKKAEDLGKGLPIVLTGDFNDTPQSEAIKNITDASKTNHLLDSKTIALKTSGTDWTFHNFGRLAESERPLIDYIFVSKQIKVQDYVVLPDTLNGTFVSDHKPVLSKITIE
ncbi:endonuclease/exonuclease/phosphatase family protein [Dysgonomonas mossii]|uniref:Endonuclease/exonuclease/phosphatase family protein n=1 Tax=Dysgonomonas mossii TaxID=163665 RepID=A0A4Y9IP22_9BACT|nr:endonuclease/exonuclease/phosphatase family protein [Dysgonomonas mossii]MBF0761317.1 endonuclease/exonuclease/phosphatase family protein [Dysgonomonas mossii]TFU90270.1 endonuclease/exonuclease/phosphatase family protein [Dysgonomonas mossii]